jgi:hypothetical protein
VIPEESTLYFLWQRWESNFPNLLGTKGYVVVVVVVDGRAIF